MVEGARSHRGERPLVTISVRDEGAGVVAHWVEHALADFRTGDLRSSDVGPAVPHTHHDLDHAGDHVH
jgi:hypothetical protein